MGLHCRLRVDVEESRCEGNRTWPFLAIQDIVQHYRSLAKSAYYLRHSGTNVPVVIVGERENKRNQYGGKEKDVRLDDC